MRLGRSSVRILLCLLLLPAVTMAQEQGRMALRLHGGMIDTSHRDHTGFQLAVDAKPVVELGLIMALDPHWSLVGGMAAPVRHSLHTPGAEVGHLRVSAPWVGIRYAPIHEVLRPFMGLGVRWSHYSDVVMAGGMDLKRHHVGLGLEAGVDLAVTDRLRLGVELHKWRTGSRLRWHGRDLGRFQWDPLVVTAGLSWSI